MTAVSGDDVRGDADRGVREERLTRLA